MSYNQANGQAGKVKIGNWFEDQALSDLKEQEYLRRKAMGHSTASALQTLRAHEEPRDRTYQSEEHVTDGDEVTVTTSVDGQEHQLGIDLRDSFPFDEDSRVFTAKQGNVAQARHLLTISHFTPAPGAPINFSDEVTLTVLGLLGQDVALASSLQTTDVFSPTTHQQAVFGLPPSAARVSIRSKFQLEYPDPEWRLEKEGTPVRCGEDVHIKHVGTGLYLSVGGVYPGLFGDEMELVARRKPTVWKM